MTFITDTIAIGNCDDAADLGAQRRAGIRSILCLNGLLSLFKAADLEVDALTSHKLRDGSGNDPWIFDRVVGLVGTYSQQHPKLLVHCHAGKSRSVMVVASHLVREHGWELRQALDHIQARRPEIVEPALLLKVWDVNNEGRIA
jgi:protein tyrosine/serine phosphatase